MRSERYKQIMKAIGMENSISLMLGLEQVANEVEQEVRKELGDRDYWKKKYIKLAELCAENKCKCEDEIKPEIKYVMKEADVGYFCTDLKCTIRRVA